MHARCVAGATALHFAAGAMDGSPCTALLLEAGAGVGDRDQRTALHVAAEQHDDLRCLLVAGADVDARDKESKDQLTALHLAAQWSNVSGVSLLLEAGAAPDVKDGDGMTPPLRGEVQRDSLRVAAAGRRPGSRWAGSGHKEAQNGSGGSFVYAIK